MSLPSNPVSRPLRHRTLLAIDCGQNGALVLANCLFFEERTFSRGSKESLPPRIGYCSTVDLKHSFFTEIFFDSSRRGGLWQFWRLDAALKWFKVGATQPFDSGYVYPCQAQKMVEATEKGLFLMSDVTLPVLLCRDGTSPGSSFFFLAVWPLETLFSSSYQRHFEYRSMSEAGIWFCTFKLHNILDRDSLSC